MRILIAGKQHFDIGGIEASTDQLARRLQRAGHRIAVLARMPAREPRVRGPRRWLLQPRAELAYTAWAVEDLPVGVALRWAGRRFGADVVVINGGGRWWHDWTRPLLRASPWPTAFYVRDVDAVEVLDDPLVRPDAVFVNAEGHVDAVRRRGYEPVVLPSIIEPEAYRVEPTGEAVVFVNPAPSKGAEVAWALAAARPDVRFLFQQSWALAPREQEQLAQRAAALSNVELAHPVTDARVFLRRARVLLAPYDDRGRPRVVAEAQVSGIPILARDVPGLRESVGDGGVLVPTDASNDEWAAALDRLWSDASFYAERAQAAIAHSRRAELDPDATAARVAEELTRIVEGARARLLVAPPPRRCRRGRARGPKSPRGASS